MLMQKEKAIFVAEPLAGEAGNLRLLLEQMGYLVRMAGTTPEALEIMRREVFIQAVVAAELTLGGELTLAQVSRLPALQRLVAFGSGGFTGVGLGVSRQKFFYVPGSHTDGVLAIIGEELGYIGIAVVMGLFVVLLWRGLMIARRADTQFGSLIAMGVLAWIAFQMLINVGGVTRLLPLTGIPLPFLSYGGSALLSIFIGMGVLLSVSRYTALPDSEAEPASGSLRRAPAPRRPATTSGGAR